MRWLLFIVLSATTVIAGLLFPAAASESKGGEHRPLDLPSGGLGLDRDEEDAPESIVFFGGMYEGDAFFFLLDKSGSMFGTKMDLLRSEMASAFDELSPQAEFGLVAFSGDFLVFAPIPLKATRQNLLAARAWVNALEAFGATQMLSAAQELLTIAHISSKESRSVIVVGDGLPNGPGPDETLSGILATNLDGLPFNTILFGVSESAITFMLQLASLTGGTYRNATP